MADYFYTERDNEFPVIDIMEAARELYTEQFKNKPVFDRYVQLLLKDDIDFKNVLEQVQKERSIHTAVGKQLDVIGDIVGRPRGVLSSELFDYFGFMYNGDPEAEPPVPPAYAPQAGSFASTTNVEVGSPWFSLKSALGTSREPTDDEYRLLIKAKILQNNTVATPEDAINAYRFLFNTGYVDVQEVGNATVLVRVGKILSTIERGLLLNFGQVGSLLPKPIGVRFIYEEFSTGRVFATKDIETGDEYGGELEPPLIVSLGDLYNSEVGGILSNKITSL